MRFKAKISKENVGVLHGVMSAFDHISHKAVLHLSPKEFKIALVTESTDAPQCYAVMSTQFLFEDYRIESQSENAILFEIGLDQLSWVLASGKVAEKAMLKLVKRGAKPCLCLEALSQSAAAMKVMHDIPIRILPTSHLVNHLPPEIPPPSVALKLPRGKMMRTIIQKLNTFSKIMFLTAKQAGRLEFRVVHAQVTIKTFYNNLVPDYTGHLTRENDSGNSASVKIDVRKLSSILSMKDLPWDDARIFIVEGTIVLIQLTLPSFEGGDGNESGTIDFYLPIMLIEDEEDLGEDGGDVV